MSIKKIRPMHDRVVVMPLEESDRSPGGIVLPGAQEKPSRGEVLAVGTGKLLENGQKRPVDLKVGDRVLFGKYAGTEFKLDTKNVLVMREEDIMAVVE